MSPCQIRQSPLPQAVVLGILETRFDDNDWLTVSIRTASDTTVATLRKRLVRQRLCCATNWTSPQPSYTQPTCSPVSASATSSKVQSLCYRIANRLLYRKRNTFTTFKPDSVAAGVGINCCTADTSFRDGGYFYYVPDNFLTSRSYPAGYGFAVGGYLCEGDSFVRGTGSIPEVGPKRFKIERKILLPAYIKSYTGFRLPPQYMTLNDL